MADVCRIDTAVAEGRKAIEFSASHTVEWAIPELFMRVGDGYFFNSDSRHSEVSPPDSFQAGSSSEIHRPELAAEPAEPNRTPRSTVAPPNDVQAERPLAVDQAPPFPTLAQAGAPAAESPDS